MPISTKAAFRRIRARHRRWVRQLISTLGWLVFSISALLLILAMSFLSATMRPYYFTTPIAPTPSMVYSSDGVLLGQLYEGHSEPVPLSRVPTHVIHAILAAEDRHFFQHQGLDFRGMLRAAWVNLRAGKIRQGGSTITQQLVRISLLDDRRTWPRKLSELVLAVRVERGQTKSEILERYLNIVYFGGGAYGIGAAAKTYFGKPVEQLTPAEGALIAGLIREPSGGSPRKNWEIAIRRQREILDTMAEMAWLSPGAYRQAVAQPIVLLPWKRPTWRAPYAVEAVRQEMLSRYNERLVYHGGLTIITSINSVYQQEAESALARAVREGRSRGVGNGALIAIEPNTGAIRAMVGGTDFAESQFNRATQAHRQPGSAFKAFVYQAALQRGHIWVDSSVDAPVSIDGWEPNNYGDRYHGRVSLRRALALSLNSVAVRLTAEVSPYAVLGAARDAGITSPLDPTMSIVLGSYEVSPQEMARAFATFAGGGNQVTPTLIQEVRDGSLLLEQAQVRSRQTVDADIAFMLTQGLRGVITDGTGRRANIGRPAAGKTGTSNDFRDAWFVGYTPYLCTAVWLGNDDHHPMRQVVGGTLPAQAWAEFMRAAHRNLPPSDFPISPGVAQVTLCSLTGELALPSCPHPVHEFVPLSRIPAQVCPVHYYVARRICKESNFLARPDCPGTEVRYFRYDQAPTAVCKLHHSHPTIIPATPTKPAKPAAPILTESPGIFTTPTETPAQPYSAKPKPNPPAEKPIDPNAGKSSKLPYFATPSTPPPPVEPAPLSPPPVKPNPPQQAPSVGLN